MNILSNEVRAALAACYARIAELEEERDRYYYETLALKRDVEFYQTPARDREYCPKCGTPREQQCPECRSTYPDR